MKKITKIKAMFIALMMLLGLIAPVTATAQKTDGFFRGYYDNYENRASIDDDGGMGHWGIGETVPVGSGLLILTTIGAGYAILRRKRSRRDASNASKTALLLAVVMLLGMTACKKKLDTIQSVAENGGVQITLDVEGANSKVIVDPTGSSTYATVTFETGDKIYVGYNNAYFGCLTYSEETHKFSGSVSIAAPVGEQPLQFYFLGGTGVQPDPSAVSNNELSVVISDQTSKYPVVSYAHSKQPYSTENTKYSAKLVSQCSIIKFNVTTPSTSPICITGMNNKVTVNFSTNAFSYDKEGDGIIKMKGVASSGAATWAIVLQQDALTVGAAGTAYTADFSYNGARAAIPEITMNQYLNEDRAMTVNTHVWNGDLEELNGTESADYATARNGMRIYNSIAAGVKTKVSIADGATVTLDDATIEYKVNGADHAGLTCLGDATIIIADGTTNTVVSGFDGDGYNNWPGIYVPQNKTLTINGNTGILNASCGQDSYGGSAAGIGCGFKSGSDCGDIIINGGVINANGGAKSAGIGGVNKRSCGNITINGGTVTAIGDSYGSATGYGAGIGTGGSIVGTATVTCGDITITGGNVTATGGRGAAGIGTGHSGGSVAITCGNITISGGTVDATGGGDADLGYEGAAAIGTGCKYTTSTVDNKCGNITITTGVTRVTATKGSSNADNSIGTSGSNNICGTVTIGGTEYWKNNAYVGTGSSYLPTSPLVYPKP